MQPGNSETTVHPLRSRRDLVAGAIFVAIALAFGWEATHYEMGRAIRMGPGFIPLTLAILLAAFGLAVAVAGFNKTGAAENGPIPWRGLALVCAALLVFGAWGRTLGLVPVVFLCVFVVALASARNTAPAALGIAALLAALCWIVFKLGLGISLPTVGPAFGPLQVF